MKFFENMSANGKEIKQIQKDDSKVKWSRKLEKEMEKDNLDIRTQMVNE